METPPDFSHASYAIIRSESISQGGMSLPSMKRMKLLEGRGVGLACPYLAQAFQTVGNLPYKYGKKTARNVHRKRQRLHHRR